MNIMIHLIDIILIVLCIFFAAMAAKKGFVKATLDFIFSVVGTVAAWFISNTFCDDIYRLLFRNYLIKMIDDKIISQINGTVESVVSSVPAWITESAVNLGIFKDQGEIAAALSGGISADAVEQSFLGPIGIFVVKAVLFIVCAALLGVLLRIISHMVGKAVRNSSARRADIALGAVLGIFKGLIVSAIVAVFLYFIAYLIPDSDFTTYVDASYFCKMAVALLNIV